MNETLNIRLPGAFDAASVSTLRRMRGDAPVASGDAGTGLPAGGSQSSASAFGAALASMRAAARRAFDSYRAYRDARATMHALQGLDDRTLHDLGYHRSEIESVAIELSVAKAR